MLWTQQLANTQTIPSNSEFFRLPARSNLIVARILLAILQLKTHCRAHHFVREHSNLVASTTVDEQRELRLAAVVVGLPASYVPTSKAHAGIALAINLNFGLVDTWYGLYNGQR